MQETQPVRSIREFWEQVWLTPSQADSEITLYRGQLQDLPLLPKLFRQPNDAKLVQQSEDKMLDLLKQVAPHLIPSKPTTDWDWLSLGQHYGMSTRMSDWSANPLVALFFAVELDPIFKGGPLVYQYPIMRSIVEQGKQDSPFTIAHTRVIQPNHSHRSEAQAAWHVVHAIHDGNFIPLTHMPPHDQRVRKIPISKGDVQKIRDELSRMGIKHSTLFGDFGSVCRSIAPSFGFS